ncbi:MAG TPA: DUF2079 domain-containing protein [Verrucomicrobiae bacterium]|nr:DUF2079 domain-containing protein [Verrucomicrobiae bacterium]
MSGSRKPSADGWMWVCIVLALAAFYGLACRKYGYFNGDTNDLLVFAYAFAQSFHGRFLPAYFTSSNLLQLHPNCILLLWLPVYALWRSFYSLMFYQSLMLTVSAWPVYLLAKRVLKNAWSALLVGVAFLLFPTIASQHVNQIHDDQFALPFIMFAMYYFHLQDFRKFTAFMVIACLAKESITITTAAFGVYALCERRSWKWVVTPIVFSAAYLVGAINVMRSGVSGIGAGLYTGTTYLDAYGKTPGEVLHTFLTRPGFVAQLVFSPPKLDYLWKLFLPALFALPFLSFAIILSLPNLVLNIIASNSAMTVIPWHYGIILGGTLVCGSILGIKRIGDWFPAWSSKLAVALPAAMVALSLYGMSFWFRAADYEPKSYQATLERAFAMIPAEATIMCPTPMLAHFAEHPRVLSAYSLLVQDKRPDRLPEFDYIILDGNWGAYEAIGQIALVRLLNEQPELRQQYRTLLQENNVYVLQRIR